LGGAPEKPFLRLESELELEPESRVEEQQLDSKGHEAESSSSVSESSMFSLVLPTSGDISPRRCALWEIYT
ncbi:MAG: hypothetical protein KAJ63_03740, partial [Methyloprofundus sp.]|nr:hypothetical protein [Methyloprofundus sp.]